MKRGMHLTAALLLLALAVPAFAAGPEYDLGAIMGQYQTAAQDFGTVIKTAAVRLAGLLFLIDLVWMVLPRLLKGPDAQELLTAVIMRLMWYCLVLWIINTPSVPLAFVNGFIKLGKDGSHLTAISPSDVFWQGIDLVNNMSSAFEKTAGALDIYPSMLLLGVEFIVVIVFAFMAGQYAVTWIQFWFFIAMYPIVMAFGITKFTKDMAMKIIPTPIVYGVRFLALYFVLSVAVKVAGFIGNDLSTMTMKNLAPLWSVAGGSIVLVLAAIKAPQMATDLLNGTSSLSAADGLGAGLAAGGAIGMVAGGAVSAATSMAGGVQSAVGKAAGVFGAAAAGVPGGGVPGGGELGGAGVPGLSGAGASPAAAAAAFAPGGGQPAAPAAPAAPSPSAGQASAPGGQASVSTAPAGGQPAAPAPSPAGVSASPAVPAAPESSRPTPPAPPAPAAADTGPAAPITPTADANAPAAADGGGSVSGAQQPAAPSESKASRITKDSARTALSEFKAGGSGGASIQVHSGGDD